MAHIMKKSSNFNRLNVKAINTELQALIIFELLNSFTSEPIHPQRMFKPGMHSPRIHHVCHTKLFQVTKPLKLFGIDELQRKRIEEDVAVDVVVDVLGEPEVPSGGEAVGGGEGEVVVAVSSHCLSLSSLYPSATGRARARVKSGAATAAVAAGRGCNGAAGGRGKKVGGLIGGERRERIGFWRGREEGSGVTRFRDGAEEKGGRVIRRKRKKRGERKARLLSVHYLLI